VETSKLNPIGLVGLGLMGSAVAPRLLAHRYPLVVWNRTREKANEWTEQGAAWSENPFEQCQRVILCLYSSEVVDAVLNQWLPSIRAGQIVIDTTTGEPSQSRQWQQRLAARGAAYLDAPISGSSRQTLEGQATVIVSGNRETFEACSDLWTVLGKRVFYVGECGNAANMKLVSNLVLGLNRAALAEGLILAERLGIDSRQALEVLRGSAAYSQQMDTKGDKMVDRDYSTQAKLSQHLKDIRLILNAAHQVGMHPGLVDVHRQWLEQGEAMGLGEMDNSAVIEVVRRMAAEGPNHTGSPIDSADRSAHE
jgi:3-hydroxyisobutyrate dehydrogenase-like beta-hydroxyacid dehydrogenase